MLPIVMEKSFPKHFNPQASFLPLNEHIWLYICFWEAFTPDLKRHLLAAEAMRKVCFYTQILLDDKKEKKKKKGCNPRHWCSCQSPGTALAQTKEVRTGVHVGLGADTTTKTAALFACLFAPDTQKKEKEWLYRWILLLDETVALKNQFVRFIQTQLIRGLFSLSASTLKPFGKQINHKSNRKRKKIKTLMGASLSSTTTTRLGFAHTPAFNVPTSRLALRFDFEDSSLRVFTSSKMH